jgi:ATP-dependent Clp protease ATP-binding subunit ClpC
MFEGFSEPARAVVRDAQEEAALMRHAHVGTEHLLVGLARGDDVAAEILHRFALDGESTRAAVVRLVGMGEEAPAGYVPFTPAARDALEGTLEEAMRLGHKTAEPGHILLAILRPQDALARRILHNAGAAPRDVRAELAQRLGDSTAPRDPERPAAVWLDDAALGDLGHPRVDGRLLLEILARRGAVAAWLRERGVDEEAVRRMLGE